MKQLRPKFAMERTTIDVPVNGEYETFVWNRYNCWQDIKEVVGAGLIPATGEQLANLLHVAFVDAPKEPESFYIRRLMQRCSITIPNINLWTPEGVYVIQQNGLFSLGKQFSQNQLESILEDAECIDGVRFSRDGKVRFAPRDSYRDNNGMTQEEFIKEGFVRATLGQEGAKKLAVVSYPHLCLFAIHPESCPKEKRFFLDAYQGDFKKTTSTLSMKDQYLVLDGDQSDVKGGIPFAIVPKQ